jgi:hypothetical protein
MPAAMNGARLAKACMSSPCTRSQRTLARVRIALDTATPEERARMPETVQPLVVTHPVTAGRGST